MVSVTPEAVESLDRALGLLADHHRGLWTQAAARIAAARTDIEQQRGRRATVVAALESALGSVRERDRAAIAAKLAAARESMRRAEHALAQANAANQRMAAIRRRMAVSLEPALTGGRVDLRRRAQALDRFSATHGRGDARRATSPLPAIPHDAMSDQLNQMQCHSGRPGNSRLFRQSDHLGLRTRRRRSAGLPVGGGDMGNDHPTRSGCRVEPGRLRRPRQGPAGTTAVANRGCIRPVSRR